MTGQLVGQVAIVTGGARGVGRAVTLALVAEGMAVAVVARTGSDLAETLAAAGNDRPVLGLRADVRDRAALIRQLAQVEQRLGPIDLLVNCAGVFEAEEGPLWAADVERTWEVVEINLRGPMLYSAAVLPDMVRRGRGRIVNVNSLAGTRPGADTTGYAVSKAALSRLTDSLHAALVGTGVSVFDLSPGLVHTAMTAGRTRWADVPATEWVPAERTGEVVVRLATGGLDALSGRFLHATDDLDTLLSRATDIAVADSRVLRLVPYGVDDPLFLD